jgi:hypothetical protein
MAGQFRSFADAVAAALGNPGTPELTALQAAGDAVDAALAAPETLAAALAQWQAAGDRLRRELIAYLLARLPASELPVPDLGQPWNGSFGVELDASLGPLALHAHSPTLTVADPRKPGGLIAVGPMPPDAFAARLDLAVVQGVDGLIG